MVGIIPTETANQNTPEKSLAFRWTYIAIPVAVLSISIVMAASLYGQLPGEVAYHFSDGAPDGWMGRGAILAWLIAPQFVLVFLAVIISGGTTILSARFGMTESVQVRKILAIMGNMVALPQVIITFALLDIFLYNIYQIHLIPLWIFAVIVVVIGSVILGLVFIRAIRQSPGQAGNSLQE